MGKTSTLGGASLTPIDQAEDSDAREEFYEKAAGKTQAQMNAHWSRVVFTGKGQPPRALSDDDQVKEAVAKDKSLIGYIDSGALDSTVKKVMSLK
jgi:ABC-type phosphate transport system substrate-binding protein